MIINSKEFLSSNSDDLNLNINKKSNTISFNRKKNNNLINNNKNSFTPKKNFKKNFFITPISKKNLNFTISDDDFDLNNINLEDGEINESLSLIDEDEENNKIKLLIEGLEILTKFISPNQNLPNYNELILNQNEFFNTINNLIKNNNSNEILNQIINKINSFEKKILKKHNKLIN